MRCWWHGHQQLLSVPLGGTNSTGFSVLGLVLVERLWDPCRHGFSLPKTRKLLYRWAATYSDDKPGSPGTHPVYAQGLQE